jgi:acyl carrier protein
MANEMSDPVLDKLLEFITRSFMVERAEIDLDKSMIDEGIIDSFGLVEIASHIEQEYGMKIDETQMIRENFGSVNKIVSFIKREAGI